jgi:hypothetical protein
MAADIVSIKGETRAERLQSSDVLWKWIDAHEKELGIGRPYLDRDAPHVGPIDGQEYFTKRIEPKMHHAEKMRQAESKAKGELALHTDRAVSKRAKAARRARALTKPTHST